MPEAIHADEAPTRPALLTLLHDQRVLLEGDDDRVEYGLRDGFPDRRAAIDWYQRATVRTLGYLADAWSPVDLARDRVLITALVTGPERRTFVDDSSELLGADAARDYRDRLERNLVLPASHRAYNDLRRRSGEYIETQDGDETDVNPADIDPSGQDHVAMRPGFQQADDRQHRALARLWGGFDDDRALMDWLHELNAATNGAVDEELPAQVGRDEVARQFLLDVDVDDESHARRYRERFAVHTLLPAFVRGIKRMSAGELAQQSKDGLTFAQG
ncbi:hypothetical protein G9C85_00145 [Halorubellus sp. JP-L1]|uniref:hypothetical protein n=1 Tax=Halorubellus sp. JP-L1 TaxID=2715753 RepID=UPI00140E0E88|nr:hypothetical protein [Halorubellus sp. JP-L1]NHN40048.1 hypothetical protein [Halorubellus sp. JP-L1]